MTEETINCRVRESDACYHGRTPAAAGMGDQRADDDGTWDGESVVCDACYIAIGQPTFNPNPGLVGGGRGTPGKQLGTPLEPDEAIALLAVSNVGPVEVIEGDDDQVDVAEPPNGKRVVHTARVGSGAFIGADWPLADVEEGIRRFRAIRLDRPVIGHGLLIVDGQGPVVLETNPAKFEAAVATATEAPE